MSLSAVLLENPLHRRGCSLFNHLFDVVVGRGGLSAGDDVQVREASVANHAQYKDFQEVLDRPNDQQLRAAVGPGAVVLAVGRLENLEGRLVAEDNTPPVLERSVLAGFGEFQPLELLVLGQLGLKLEIAWLQCEAGFQIAVDSRLGDRGLHRRQFLSQCSHGVVTSEGRLRHDDLGHSADG